MGELTKGQVQELVERYIRRSIERLDSVFKDHPDKPYDDPQSLHWCIDGLSVVRQDVIDNMNLGDYSMLEGAIDAFLKENGIDKTDKQSPAYRQLCLAVHKAETQLIPIQQQHLQVIPSDKSVFLLYL